MTITVAILGASIKPDRYANKAQIRLMEHSYRVLPISPTGKTVLGVSGLHNLREVTEPVDTVTLYVSPKNLRPQLEDLLALKPRRVIFNPGTEDQAIQETLEQAGIRAVEACTLVLLNIGQFDEA